MPEAPRRASKRRCLLGARWVRRTGGLVFARTPGTRPAAVAGLVNGLAIGTPLLVGLVASDPAAGAAACVGAYVAAFTNKGGARGPRTVGLLVAALINTVTFSLGALTAPLFPVDVLILALLVFVAAMGDTFGSTADRCGTMPATAFLAGMAAPSVHSLPIAVLLVACGGLWYALATMMLTPTTHLRQVRAMIGLLYRELAAAAADLGGDSTARHPAPTVVLRQAHDAVIVLAAPGGDDALADEASRLVGSAAALNDAFAAVCAIGTPDPTLDVEYRKLLTALQARLLAIANAVTDGAPARRGVSDDSLTDYIRAIERLRENVIRGSAAYEQLALAAQRRRRMIAISADIDDAVEHAARFGRRPDVSLPDAPASAASSITLHTIRDAFRLTSTPYRHALRATLISTTLFTAVTLAHLPHGEWAVLAALRVLRPQYGVTAQRASQRVVGNIIGGTGAAVTIAWISSPTVLAALVFAIIAIGFALRPVNYAFWVVFGTPLILLIGDLATPGDWQAAVGRIAMTLVGSAAALIGYYLILPEWDVNRVPGQVDETTDATVDYLDAALAHVTDPRPSPHAEVQAARARAASALTKASDTLEHAQREPRYSEMRSHAHILELLNELQTEVTALTALPPARSAPIPHYAEFRRSAVSAIRAAGTQAGVADAVAVAAAVSGMGEYLRVLHAQRLTELSADLDAEMPARVAIRENQPVIDQLRRIAETVNMLMSTITSASG